MFLRIFSISALIIFLFVTYTYSQSKNDNQVIAQFDGQKITVGQFVKAYAKSGAGSGDIKKDSLSQLKNFFTLYVEYRMKLEDGKERGFERNPDVIKELNNYRDQFAYKLYTDKYLIEPNIKDLYEKRKWEYRVSQIMFRTTKKDSIEDLKLANEILDSLKSGADFSEMAAKYSVDNYSKNIGGDVYYVTADRLPANFEEAIIKTPVGEIYPHVIKTNYGYHIIKVTEKHKRVPKIRVSHLLIKYTFDDKPDTARAKAIIDTVYQKLKDGIDFDKLVHQYSMDKGTVDKNGDLGFISRNKTVRPFDEAAFRLQNVGDVSGIVKTRFGFHIIKLTEKPDYPSFEEEKDELIRIFKGSDYFDKYDKLLDSLITKHNLVENKLIVDHIISIADTSKQGLEIENLPDSIKNSILYTLAGERATVNDFIQLALNQGNGAYLKPGVSFNTAVKRVAGQYLITKDALKYLQNDSSFISLMDDYKKGTIIFKLQQDEVWSQIKPDSAALLNYYTKNINKYRWPDRVRFTELFTRNDSLIQYYQAMINNGVNFDTLCSKYTERPGFRERIGHWALEDKDLNDLYKLAWEIDRPGQFSNIFKNFVGYSIIRLDAKDPARGKTFEEARPEVSSDYQEMKTKQLQQAYLDKLNKKYKPVIDYKEFEKIFSEK